LPGDILVAKEQQRYRSGVHQNTVARDHIRCVFFSIDQRRGVIQLRPKRGDFTAIAVDVLDDDIHRVGWADVSGAFGGLGGAAACENCKNDERQYERRTLNVERRTSK